MRLFVFLFFIPLLGFSQHAVNNSFEKDSLFIIESDPGKDFHNSYLLFIPKGTPKNKPTYLLVEPNNTGRRSDSMEVHMNSAIHQATVSGVGNNISTELKIPFLVPIFPRPESKPLVYSHALDRDVMFEETPQLERLDIQLVAMINDARKILEEIEVFTEEKIFMNGFSASATFTNRFLFIHPHLIEAAATGGLNGNLMLPLNTYKEAALNFPLGINDYEDLFGKEFERDLYLSIPQFIYMGALDDNDMVQFNDGYNDEERNIINSHLGANVQERWEKCQALYRENNVKTIFRTYEDVGHWTTSSINLDVIKFFFGQMQKK